MPNAIASSIQEKDADSVDSDLVHGRSIRTSVMLLSAMIGTVLCLLSGVASKRSPRFIPMEQSTAQHFDKPSKNKTRAFANSDHRLSLRQQRHHHVPPILHGRRMQNRLQHDFVDCSRYEYTMSITNDLRINYVLNMDENSPGGGNFSAELIYQGQGWLGFAHSESGSMIGSVAVIGLPDAPETHQVQKYYLGSQETDLTGIQALQAMQQTLMDTTMEQNEFETIMRFTKLLSEPDELSIHPDLQNTFLFAIGASNTLGHHKIRGILVLDLGHCVPYGDASSVQVGRDRDEEDAEDRYMESSYVVSISGGDDNSNAPLPDENVIEVGSISDMRSNIPSNDDLQEKMQNDDSPLNSDEDANKSGILDLHEEFTVGDDDLYLDEDSAPSSSKTGEARSYQVWWTVHGIFATLTCGILLPMVIASSMLRGCFGGKRRGDQISNNRLYRWSNVLLVITVSITFVTAFMGAQKDSTAGYSTAVGPESNPTHDRPGAYHSPFGLSLFIIIVFYGITGTLRSYVLVVLKAKGLRDLNKDKSSNQSDFNSEEITNADSGLANFVRMAWDRSHLFVGFVILFIACWESKIGLELYAYRFEESWFGSTFFWCISGPVIGVIGFLCILQMCYLMLQWCYNAAYW